MKPVRVDSITGIFPFIASVDWANDRWLYVVLLFHITCMTNIIVFRKNHVVQTFVFVVLMVSVYGAEYINEWAAKNYKSFSTEQYFDSNGLFFSVFYSFPALLNCCIVLFLWLYESGVLMFQAKRQQLLRRHGRTQEKSTSTPENATKKRERLRRRPKIDEVQTESVEANGDAGGDKKDD